ncbi:MAG: 5'-nucleotidase C-terminal domain-containing protein, partial [Lachnospiraceae bacterium]|nr:5'-nucleotidase C-terminal domain-containing protein [Lachnospiraceae bacterium]
MLSVPAYASEVDDSGVVVEEVTDEAADETAEEDDETVAAEESTDETVDTEESADETIAEEESTDETDGTEEGTDETVVTEEVTEEVTVTLAAAAAAEEETDSTTTTETGQFVIMSTTDVHGKIWDTNLLNDTSVNNSLLNVSTAVSEYRDEYGEENVILLDAGDLYQGTPVSTYQISLYTQYLNGVTTNWDDMYLINPTAMSMAYIGYDALILGNHEFNYSWDTMSDIYEYLEGQDIPIIVANLYYESTGERVFEPYLLKTVEVGGEEVTIGIIGLENTDCTRWDVEDNYPGMIFSAPDNPDLDLAVEVQSVQDEWAEAGIDPDFVIVCYHGALGDGGETVTYAETTENQVLHIIQNTTGVDMVISGHDHSTSYSNNSYQNADGEDVLVVNGGGTTLTASVWNVTVDTATGETSVSVDDATGIDISDDEETADETETETTITIEKESSENLTLSNYAKDTTLQAMVEPYATGAEEYVNTSVGMILDWDGIANTNNSYYLQQTDTVDLINRAQIAEGGEGLNAKYSSVDKLNEKLQEMYGSDTTKQFTEDDLVDGELVVDLSSTSIVTTTTPSAGNSELSMKDIYGFYKYDNSLYLLALTGSEIKDLLEYNASERIVVSFKDGEAVFSDTGDYNANYTFPVFYGLNYTIDMAQEEGERVIIEGFSNGKEFSEDGLYVVAINNYHLGNSYNDCLGLYSTSDAIWSQTDDLGGGYVQDLIAEYVGELTETYGGVYSTSEAAKNDENVCTWSITYNGEIPTETTVSDSTTYVGTLTTTLSDGDQVMIYNVYNDYAISSSYYSESTPTLAVTSGTVIDSNVYVESGAAIFTVGVTDEGYYTFLTDDGYLTSNATGSGLGYTEEATDYSLWELVEISEGVYSVKNVNAIYGGYSAQYLEYYYGKFTTYGGGASGGNAFETSFYTVQTSGTYVDPTNLADGDNLLIYYPNGETVIGEYSSTKFSAVSAELVATESGGSVVVPEDGAVVFTVGITEDGYYTFSTSEGYLYTTARNSIGLTEDFSDYCCWTISEATDGYNVENVGVSGVYLEYYYGFTTYTSSYASTSNAYIFNFYKVGAVSSSAEEEELEGYTLKIFETTDVHGYLVDTSSGDSSTYQYRLAYIADDVDDARDVYDVDDVLLVDTGDIYQGNVISNLQDGQPMTAAYDLMEYDVVSIGNHEFDWGYEVVIDEDGTMSSYSVGDYEGDSEIPVIASNLYQDGDKITFADDYIILEKSAVDEDGNVITVKIGIIGWVASYATDIMYAQFTGRGFTVDLDYDALEDLAVELETEKGCDATILLAHADAAGTASGLNSGTVIDLVCGGHTHSAQTGTVNGVTYMEAANQAANYCYAELVFETDENDNITNVGVSTKKIVSVTGDTSKLYDTEDNEDELDQEIVALSQAAVENVSDVLNETLGYITTSALKTAIGSNSMSSTAGNWMTSLMARSVGADVAFTNNGGIRTTYEVDEETGYRYISAGDIYTISPFCNAIYAYEITYADLLEILEYSLDGGSALGLRMSGIDCYYTGKTVNALVTSDGTLIYQDGEWVDDWAAQTLVVATNEYVATSDTPFADWNDTDQLLSKDTIDNEGAIAALKAEAEVSGGYLYVDPNAHMIVGTYTAETHTHEYTEVTFEPTCTEQGYTIHICESCGDYYYTDYTDATGHTYVDGVCTICGETEPAEEPETENVITGTASYKKTYGDADFTLDVTAAGTLSYKSLDESVVTVSEAGVVSIQGVGTTYIVVNAAATSTADAAEPFVVAVTVSKAEQTITGTTSYTKTYGDDDFTLDVTAEGTISYLSSDHNVVVVSDEGVVTIKGTGTAVITAIASSTDTLKGTALKITVTVNAAEKPAVGDTYTQGILQYKVTGSNIAKVVKLLDKTVSSVTIPDTITINGYTYKVTSIKSGTFANVTSLKSVTIGGNVKVIGKKAFYGCTGLTTIAIPDSVTSIYASAFEKCTSLKTVTGCASLKEIQPRAFYGCTALKTVEGCKKVTYIGERAFCRCTSLTTIGSTSGVVT